MTVDTTSSSKSTPATSTASAAAAAASSASTQSSSSSSSQSASNPAAPPSNLPLSAASSSSSSQSYSSPPHVLKKNRSEVIRTIQEITKFDEFTINQAIEACQDKEGLYSMDQVLNILMDEKYSNEYQQQDSGGSGHSRNSTGYRSQNSSGEDASNKYRGATTSKDRSNDFSGNMYGATNNLDDDDDDDFETPASPSTLTASEASSGAGAKGSARGESHLYREEGKPAGLKNVGNTCWFNSIIQAFFHLPAFRRLILTFQIDAEDVAKLDENSKNVVNFVVELRKLFALMYRSKRKAINPNNTLRFLRNCSKYDVETFNQEDVSEFATILVNLIEESFDVLAKVQQQRAAAAPSPAASSATDEAIIENYLSALNLSSPSKSSGSGGGGGGSGGGGGGGTGDLQLNITNSNLINFRKNRKNPIVNLLNGDMLISRKNLDEDTTNYIIEIFREVNIQMLNSRNLHAGLELEWGETSIDKLGGGGGGGASESGKSATTTPVASAAPKTPPAASSMNRSFYEQESWLLKLPSVLFVCLNRYKFVKATQSSSKIIEPFEFYPHVYLDRYMHANKEVIKTKRKELKLLNAELRRLEEKLESINKYQHGAGSPSYALDEAFKCVLHFTASDYSASDVFGGIKSEEQETAAVRKCLEEWIRRTEAKIGELERAIAEVKQRIGGVYEEEALKKVKYHLHSVCIHEGSATLGHFWTYIWNKQQAKWYKFNDTEVSESTWDDLYANAVGGASSSSSSSNQRASSQPPAENASSKSSTETPMNLTLETSGNESKAAGNDKTPSAYFLIYTREEDAASEETAAGEASFEMAPDLARLLVQDQETLESQIYSLKLKQMFKDLSERLKKSNQAIANLNYQQPNSDQHYQTCLEHAKTFSESTLESLTASFDRIIPLGNSNLRPDEYGPEEALKYAIELEMKKYAEPPKDVLAKLPEVDARINHIVTYFSANNLSRDLRVLALLDIFRIQIFSDAEIRLKILQTLAQIKYNEYVKAHASSTATATAASAASPVSAASGGVISSELLKSYEKWQTDYRDYRSIIAAFVNASNLLEAQKYEEATPFFCVTCEYNERITSNLQFKMKGMDHEFLLAIRRKCLKQWNQATIRKFTQSNAGSHHQQQLTQVELTSLIETMINKFLPCFFRLATSTSEDKAMIEEIRRDWLTVLDSNLPEMPIFHDFMTKLFEEPLANHYHSLNVNKTSLVSRYKDTVNSLHTIHRPH